MFERAAAYDRSLVAIGLVLSLGLLGCGSSTEPDEETRESVTAGTIGGVGFTVIDGEAYQDVSDGPVEGGPEGALILLDETPAGLGMTDPTFLQLHTEFELEDGGTLEQRAFGTPDDLLASGHSLVLSRSGTDLTYEVLLGGSPFTEPLAHPEPVDSDGPHWIVVEFYAESVPGYGSNRSGVTVWPLNDVEPAFNTDLLSCNPGPAMQQGILEEERVGYRLQGATLLSVQVVDEIIGPCE